MGLRDEDERREGGRGERLHLPFCKKIQYLRRRGVGGEWEGANAKPPESDLDLQRI